MSSFYPALPLEYRDIFTAKRIPLSHPNYPIAYLEALIDLTNKAEEAKNRKGAMRGNLAESKKAIVGKNVGLFGGLKGLYLSTEMPDFPNKFGYHNEMDLFFSQDCQGKISIALDQIKILMHKTNYSSPYNELIVTELFLHDICKLWISGRASKKRIDYHDRPFDISDVFLGVCYFCHRPKRPKKYYCDIHSPGSGKYDTEIRRQKRAWQEIEKHLEGQLGYIYDYTNNCKIPTPATIKTKLAKTPIEISSYLFRWAKFNTFHTEFCKAVDEISEPYFYSFGSRIWEAGHLLMLQKIADLSRAHLHLNKLFKVRALQGINEELDMLHEIQNEFLNIKFDFILDPEQFVEAIRRISMFSLIKIVAGKSNKLKPSVLLASLRD